MHNTNLSFRKNILLYFSFVNQSPLPSGVSIRAERHTCQNMYFPVKLKAVKKSTKFQTPISYLTRKQYELLKQGFGHLNISLGFLQKRKGTGRPIFEMQALTEWLMKLAYQFSIANGIQKAFYANVVSDIEKQYVLGI